ncbi:DUF5666 domain-containing protein [Parvularcula oceani]|uniref:DUF5666 domain-containing protein n=1 Tax=Parvularcula oceani TaxID=1247963 RepID=UPI0004E14260|nr:DUF5666 domain-containing protein [Parvularcula oceani]
MRDIKAPSLLALVAALSACQQDSAPEPEPAQVTPPTAVSQSNVAVDGTITGFSSVFVNGKKYELGNSTIVAVEGKGEFAGGQDRLRLGMRVRIKAVEQNGERRAGRIEVDQDLKGPVFSVTPDAETPSIGTLTVVGQTVVVDGFTIFSEDIPDENGDGLIDIRDLDPTTTLPAAVVIEVSGLPTEQGLVASRIERIDRSGSGDEDEIEVKGFIDAVVDGGTAIVINDARFEILGTTEFDQDFPPLEDAVGLFVEVKAEIDDEGRMVAIEVEREDDLDDDDREGEFEFEGLVQTVDVSVTPHRVTLGGMTLETPDASALTGLVGQRVEVEGSFDSEGLLVIEEVKVEVENTVRTEDEVVSVDRAAGTFTTRMGIVVTPTGDSRVSDRVDPSQGHLLTPDEFMRRIAIGDYVKARGYPDDADAVVWTRIERSRREREACRLRGPVDAGSIVGSRFAIRGVTVETSALPDDAFEAGDDAEGRDAFFELLSEGTVVDAKSDRRGGGCQLNALLLSSEGEVSFAGDDDVEGSQTREEEREGGEGEGAGADLVGTVRSVDGAAATLTIGERVIPVLDDTEIDADLVEAARGVEVDEDSFRFGELPETLDQLVEAGDRLEVELDADGNAESIELAD